VATNPIMSRNAMLAAIIMGRRSDRHPSVRPNAQLMSSMPTGL
jgi:hypothetical protein